MSYFLLTHSPNTLSGYKAHVFSTTPEQAEMVMARIADAADQYGWGVKVGTAAFFALADENHNQHGKGVTVYFPKLDDFQSDLDWLLRLLEGYPFAGTIKGDDMVSDAVGVRYEFHSDPGYDIPAEDAAQWYQAAH